MNKKIGIFISLFIILFTVINFIIYQKSVKQLKNDFYSFQNFKLKSQKIIKLKNKYSLKPIKIIKKYCKISQNENIYKLKCKININNINRISFFLKSNIKIKQFTVKTDKNIINFVAEIYK